MEGAELDAALSAIRDDLASIRAGQDRAELQRAEVVQLVTRALELAETAAGLLDNPAVRFALSRKARRAGVATGGNPAAAFVEGVPS